MVVVEACEGMHLTVVGFVLNAVEDAFEHLYTSGVAHENHIVGKGVSGQVYVVQASVGGQHQFA